MASIWGGVLDVHPIIYGGLILGTLVSIWALSYVMDWLYKLEAGVRVIVPEGYLEDPTSLQKVPLPSLFSPPSVYLSLILPAFNEEHRLTLTMEETMGYLTQRSIQDANFTYEVIIVDDGSSDKTVERALEYVKKYGLEVVRVIKMGVNQGKGAAVRKGMQCGRGELLLFADADGATKITETEKLEAEIKAVAGREGGSRRKGVVVVPGVAQPGGGVGEAMAAAFGSRAHLEKMALAKRKWYRNFLMFGFHFCVLLVAGPGIKDTQCGFKMFTRKAAQLLFPNQRLNRWCFDVELVALCKRLGIVMKEVSVTWTEIPGSKIRITSILHMLMELALIRLGYGFRIWKIHRIFDN